MSTKYSASLATTLNIENFLNLCMNFTPDIAVMVRGRHGIGKSQVIYQLSEKLRDDFYKDTENCKAMVEALKNEPHVAKKLRKSGGIWTYEMGVPVVERRLSQMTEGDIIGLPFLEKNGTEFKPVSWIINSCKFPVVLFLDELNRAIKGVEQATFQLADSKAFYGNLLNEGTRIYIAVNIGASYAVEQFDPAALSRYAIVDLQPSAEEFISFVRKNCNPVMADFFSSNPNAIEHKDTFEPDAKYHDRRAWVRLDGQLTAAKLYDNPDTNLFLNMCAAMVGFQFGNAYWNYVKNNQLNLSAKDVLYKWTKTRENLPKDQNLRFKLCIELAEKVCNFLKENDLTKEAEKVGPELNLFLKDAPGECSPKLFASLSEGKNLKALNPYISKTILANVMGTREKQETKPQEEQNVTPKFKK